MAHAARILKFRGAHVSDERLMRLVRFPAVRRAISGALERAVPEKAVDSGRGYIRFRIEDPSRFHPALFATIPVGSRGTLLVIGTPKAHIKKKAALEAFLRRMGRGLRTEARRSLIYQLRRAGIVGGSRTQAVLVPRGRVLSVASRYLASAGRTAANPILATLGFNPGRRAASNAYACYKCGKQIKGEVTHHVPPILHERLGVDFRKAFHPSCYKEWQAAAGRELGLKNAGRAKNSNPLTTRESARLLSDARYYARQARVSEHASPRASTYFSGRAIGESVAVHRYGVKRARRAALKIKRRADDAFLRAAANPAPAGVTRIDVPFRKGQKVTTAQIERWLRSLPPSPFRTMALRRFEMGKRQYKSFHKGALPESWTFNPQSLGMSPGLTDIDFVVSEGKEWAAAYQVPRHSRKFESRTQGRYVHAHGDSKMAIDIKRAAPTRKLPERFHTPDGKFVGVIPSRNVKITDWYRG